MLNESVFQFGKKMNRVPKNKLHLIKSPKLCKKPEVFSDKKLSKRPHISENLYKLPVEAL